MRNQNVYEGQGHKLTRVIGTYRGDRAGPTVIALGGVHGNELAGLTAIHRILRGLRDGGRSFCGEFVGLAGNIAALREGRRYIDEDLNRLWTDHPSDGESNNGGGRVERRERRELAETLQQTIERARGTVFVLDLHTTSGKGAPFVVFADTPRNRVFAAELAVPMILGFERFLVGTLLHALARGGHTAVAFEGGRTGDPRAVDHLESALWLALAAAGSTEPGSRPENADHRRRLVRATTGLPTTLTVDHRHAVEAQDGFRMVPGLHTFRWVERGDKLAEDSRGDIRAPQRGYLLLPRYQGLGDDGFFIARTSTSPGSPA